MPDSALNEKNDEHFSGQNEQNGLNHVLPKDEGYGKKSFSLNTIPGLAAAVD